MKPFFSVCLRTDATKLALALIAVVVLMQVELAYTKSINWDEFFHFSEIHRHLQGRPLQWLQVPYVWLFSWVPSGDGENIADIQLIRLLILPFELVTVGAIVASARCLADREAALFCGLLYVTGGYVFLHAFALRGDMIAASLLMMALWIGLCRPLRTFEIFVAAALVGLAFVATIKTVLYVPAFLGVALHRMKKHSHRWMLLGAFAALLLIGSLVLWIAPNLSTTGTAGIVRDVGLLGRDSVARMFSAGLFPQPRWLQGEILRAPLLTITLLLTFIFVAIERKRPAMDRLLSLFLLLPLSTVVVYRNACPYHFAFILPPAMIAAAPAMAFLLRRYGAVPIGTLLLIITLFLSLSEDRSVLTRQQAIQAGVHEIFPTPVTYIDDCGMLSEFPRAVNQFASGWALANYHRDRQAVYSMAMHQEPVPLLLADSDLLTYEFLTHTEGVLLLPKDERAIRENYIQHWGRVLVAGKRIASGNDDQTFSIAIPGTYTVEGGDILIDGVSYRAGNVIDLARGPHTASGNRPVRVTLRWGNHLPRPSYSWPNDPIFTDF
jgi:hypothetical protein